MIIEKKLVACAVVGGLLAFALPASANAEQVVCHYTYGGESGELTADPVGSPYNVKGIPVGSYFRFRVVFRDQPADLASIKVYVYFDREPAFMPIHQATYPYPPPESSSPGYGFTGRHFIYEPRSGSELQYWCRLAQPLPVAPSSGAGSGQ